MKIFIGSSSERYPVAKEIQRDLLAKLQPREVEMVTWQDWFKRGDNYGLDTWTIIIKAIDYFDCAIMLLAGDDKIEIRDKEYYSSRDNVLIESGAFAKEKGMEKVFLLIDKDDQYHIPSDYRGLNAIPFDYKRGADNPDAYDTMIEKIIQIETSKIGGVVSPITSDFGKYKDEKAFVKKEKRGKIK